MARVSTLNSKLEQIKRRYKKVSPQRYFYNNKKDLSARFNRILCWFLIHDAQRGYNIFPIIFRRAVFLGVAEWLQMIRKPTPAMRSAKTGKQYESLMYLFTQQILPAINNKSSSVWRFKAFIGYTGADDIRQSKNPNTNTKRNKATKKRAANARNTYRRRHRNKAR